MSPDISTLRQRMSKGGDWFEFREEISNLHGLAQSEEEYVELLIAHRTLSAVAEEVFEGEKLDDIRNVAEAEYLMFLNIEASENDIINPKLLDRVTTREVDAGRMADNHNLRQLASAGAAVLGDSAELYAHRCRQGDWLFAGVALAAVGAFGLTYLGVSALWLIPVGLIAGWMLNERERTRIKADIADSRI